MHYISSCQGELTNTTFQVKAQAADGEVLHDGPITSLQNGFFEIWLPRDKTVVTTVKYDGKAVTGTLGTHADSPTCITTFQLK